MIAYVCTLAGLVFVLLGSAGVYLASPNQRWLVSPLRRGPARTAGTGCWLLGWLCFAQTMTALTAIFALATTLMLALVLLPYAGALRSLRREP
ncbi:hypothetical protein [Variovorax sp.]|uniref:hypothetical protein n=1 Tax=Variovorax sp. TaxID=1871043 RepID=UPI002D6E9925|nr:hypothetical protein [Variovorax sp.]HYP83060.1 hypothetical protein [Variovorax sp.]